MLEKGQLAKINAAHALMELLRSAKDNGTESRRSGQSTIGKQSLLWNTEGKEEITWLTGGTQHAQRPHDNREHDKKRNKWRQKEDEMVGRSQTIKDNIQPYRSKHEVFNNPKNNGKMPFWKIILHDGHSVWNRRLIRTQETLMHHGDLSGQGV